MRLVQDVLLILVAVTILVMVWTMLIMAFVDAYRRRSR